MNNKGVVFSAYIYVLLVFFLLSLAGLLLVLNNTKMLSDKAKEGSGGIVNQDNYDFSIELIGDSNVCLNLGDEYTESGFTAKDKDGNELPVVIDSNLDIWKSGIYAINYTTKYKNKDKTISRKVTVLKNDYAYTGNSQEFITGCDGYFKIELWGASGGNATYTTLYTGGLGAYTSGEIYLKKNEKLYIFVGGQGQTVSGTTSGTLTANGNGYNGGAAGSFAASNSTHGGGGGSTDIRLISGLWNNSIGLNSRVMVAGGGGGASSHASTPSYSGNGGSGGTLIGGKAVNGSDTCYAYGTGGTNNSGGASTTCVTDGHAYAGVATFGVGHSPFSVYTSTGGYNAGGGGGYYGGGSGYHAGSGGGSSYISGYSGSNSITNDISLTHSNNTVHYSNKYFIDAYMQSGVNTGNGKAKITYIGKTYDKKNTKLDNVRYIKDCINGSTANTGNHWVELQIIKDGTNIAYGKKVTGTTATTGTYDYSVVTDGNITTSIYAANDGGAQCITIDLGKVYDIDEIAVWHYYADGRTYFANTTYISNNNVNWTSVINNTNAESSTGKRISAYSTDNSKYYAQSGLLLHVDGINNTGTGHNSTASVWRDLSGNGNDGAVNNFTMSGQNGWISNALSFTKGNSHVQFNRPIIPANGDFTVEMILLNRDVSATGVFLGQSDGSANRMSIDIEYNNTFITPLTQYTTFKNKNGQANTALSYLESDGSNTNVIQSIVVTRSGTKGTYRLNNNTTDSKDTFFDYPVNQANTVFGYWGVVGSLSIDANIYSVRIYNRTLTDEEITQNYEVDKARFGF